MERMEDNNYYWQFLNAAMHEMKEPLNALNGFSYVLREKECQNQLMMADDERRFVLGRMDMAIGCLTDDVDTLIDLAYYSSALKLEKKDRVLVNQLCRDVRHDRAVTVEVESDLSDCYAVKTNREALTKVLSALTDHACDRVMNRRRELRDAQVLISVTDKAKKGKLTFSVSDNAGPTTIGEDMKVFVPPSATIGHPLYFRMIRIYNCRLIVKLLGGLIHIEPKSEDGRRVVFTIAL